MKAKRISQKAVKNMINGNTALLHIGNFDTGKRTNLKRAVSECVYTSRLYYNKELQIDSPRYKEIEALEKPIWNTPIYKLLELTITETPLDGRTRYAKQLPVYNVDVLAELTY